MPAKRGPPGLGRTISYKILEQHEAPIDIKSQENKGSSFSLHFFRQEGINRKCIEMRFSSSMMTDCS
jgi:signal transduction histidine kinase